MSTKWFDIGKELGLTGSELLSFVEKREKLDRDERQANREERNEEEKILKMKLELAQIQSQSNSTNGNDNGNGRRLALSRGKTTWMHILIGLRNMQRVSHGLRLAGLLVLVHFCRARPLMSILDCQ